MLNNHPLVSVLMPVYNTENYLEDAIQSILSQSFSDFEFIIINDGSTDCSQRILDKFQLLDPRIKALHQENSGIVTALNKGLKMAVGKYIARMDSDDISLPDRLAKQLEFMENNANIGICGTACIYFGDRSGIGGTTTDSNEIKCRLLFWPSLVHPTVMIRRELVVDKGLYYRSGVTHAEDYEYWVRSSAYCDIANLPEPLLMCRAREGQTITSFKSEGDRSAMLVRRQLIGTLGIEASDEEMELHQSLISEYNGQISRDYIFKLDNWLHKLLDANDKLQIFDNNALADLLFDRWWNKCLNATKLGLWLWIKNRTSRLYKNNHLPVRARVSFALRCLLRTHYRGYKN